MCELQFPAYEYNDSVKNWKKWREKGEKNRSPTETKTHSTTIWNRISVNKASEYAEHVKKY